MAQKHTECKRKHWLLFHVQDMADIHSTAKQKHSQTKTETTELERMPASIFNMQGATKKLIWKLQGMPTFIPHRRQGKHKNTANRTRETRENTNLYSSWNGTADTVPQLSEAACLLLWSMVWTKMTYYSHYSYSTLYIHTKMKDKKMWGRWN